MKPKTLLDDIFKTILNHTKNYRVLAWGFIILLLLVILIYPILDANFLYYGRETKRVELLKNIIDIDQEKVAFDERTVAEYNAMLDDLEFSRTRQLENVINFHDTQHISVKFAAGSWLFIALGVLALFSRGKDGKRSLSKNLSALLAGIVIGVVLGAIAAAMPTIISPLVNIILYQIISFFLAYTIYVATSKEMKQ